MKRLEQEGVQAAIEIQLSARKVAEENKRLRRLLRHVGVHEETINSWDSDSERPCLRSELYGEAVVNIEVPGQAGATAPAALTEPDDCAVGTLPPNYDSPARKGNLSTAKESSLFKNGELVDRASLSSDITHDVRKLYANHQYRSSSPDGSNSSSIIRTPSAHCKRNCNFPDRKGDSSTLKDSPLSKSRESIDSANLQSDITPNDWQTDANHQHRVSSVDVPSCDPIPTPSAPCKLLSRLTVNPTADLTQIPLAPADREGNIAVDDGIPCARAYQMLIHYATSEPKLDAVAGILEEGCVPNEGPGGGCRVRSKTIMKALDDVCL